jgi:hypothetical protein
VDWNWPKFVYLFADIIKLLQEIITSCWFFEGKERRCDSLSTTKKPWMVTDEQNGNFPIRQPSIKSHHIPLVHYIDMHKQVKEISSCRQTLKLYCKNLNCKSMAIKEIQWPSSSWHLFNIKAYSFGVAKDFKNHAHLSAQEQFDGLCPSSSCSLGMVLLSTLEAMKKKWSWFWCPGSPT